MSFADAGTPGGFDRRTLTHAAELGEAVAGLDVSAIPAGRPPEEGRVKEVTSPALAGCGYDAPMDADRRRIARHLAEHGPTHGDRLAAALGMTEERFWVLINHPWFALVTGGYDLTAQGRAEGLGETQ